MKAFAALYRELDASTSSLAKQAALQRYLRAVPPADAAWAVYFLAGGKPRQLVPTKLLRSLARDVAGLPEWLFDESYEAVGDLAETISLLLPAPAAPVARGLAAWIEQHLPNRRRGIGARSGNGPDVLTRIGSAGYTGSERVPLAVFHPHAQPRN